MGWTKKFLKKDDDPVLREGLSLFLASLSSLSTTFSTTTSFCTLLYILAALSWAQRDVDCDFRLLRQAHWLGHLANTFTRTRNSNILNFKHYFTSPSHKFSLIFFSGADDVKEDFLVSLPCYFMKSDVPSPYLTKLYYLLTTSLPCKMHYISRHFHLQSLITTVLVGLLLPFEMGNVNRKYLTLKPPNSAAQPTHWKAKVIQPRMMNMRGVRCKTTGSVKYLNRKVSVHKNTRAAN